MANLERKKVLPIIIAGVLLAGAIIAGVTILQDEGILPSYTTTTSYQGTLIVRIFDPPHVPKGVTDSYVTYTNLWVHEEGENPRWISLNQSGSIDLMSVVDSIRTIATTKVSYGSFDMFRMSVTSAVVTYEGKNYTALVEEGLFTAEISGGSLSLTNAQSTAGAVIDISPTVLMQNSSSSLSFAFVPSASAYAVPNYALQSNDQQLGNEDNLTSEAWLVSDQSSAGQFELNISAISLSSSGLSVNVSNTGNASAFLETLFITPYNASSSGAVLFAVLSNGSLVPTIDSQYYDNLSIGYNISSGANAEFDYVGAIPPPPDNSSSIQSALDNLTTDTVSSTITQGNSTTTISTGNSSMPDLVWSDVQITTGQQYVIGAVAGDTIATTTVVAS